MHGLCRSVCSQGKKTMRVATSVCMSEMPSASITRRGNRVRVKYKALTYLLTRPTAPGNRVARGGTQGGLNCLTHALPRCLPTPTEEADGNGYGVITGRGGPSRPPPRVSVNLVPLLLTGVRHHPPGRTDKNLCRCFGAPARRVFPDHLITGKNIVRRSTPSRIPHPPAHHPRVAPACRVFPDHLISVSK